MHSQPLTTQAQDTFCLSAWSTLVDLLHQDADKGRIAALLEHARLLPDASAGKVGLTRGLEQAMAIKDRAQQLQQRERGLLAVLESAQDLTAITDIDRVLQTIVQRARKLVGCDIGYLSIFDADCGDFYVRATDGAFSDQFKHVRVAMDVGVCGYVARNRQAYASSDYEADTRFAHASLIDSAMADENIKSILGVPLLAGDVVIGVLFVGDRYIRSYPAWEKSILSTLAAHASIAIGNARLFEQEQAALREASDTNRLLARRTSDTRVAADAHEQLTALVARGGDLAEVCSMVARMLGGRVVVYDEGEQPVCSSGVGVDTSSATSAATLRRSGSQSDDYWLADRIHAALTESRTRGRSVSAFEQANECCRVSAVLGGRGMLGALAIFTETPLQEFEVRIFERASMITAVLLLSIERRESAHVLQMSGTVRGLIGQPQHSLTQCAAQLASMGVDVSQPVCLAVIQLAAGQAAYLFKRMQANPQPSGVVFDCIGQQLVLLGSPDALAGAAARAASFVPERASQDLVGVVSEPVISPEALPQKYTQLLDCLRLLAVLRRSGNVFQERELSLYATLFKGQDLERISTHMSAVLGSLYASPGSRQAELASTLLTYFDSGHNARTAAKRLGVHINTVHQRLDAVDVLLGNWRDSTRALDIHMALRLWQLAPGINVSGA